MTKVRVNGVVRQTSGSCDKSTSGVNSSSGVNSKSRGKSKSGGGKSKRGGGGGGGGGKSNIVVESPIVEGGAQLQAQALGVSECVDAQLGDNVGVANTVVETEVGNVRGEVEGGVGTNSIAGEEGAPSRGQKRKKKS